MARVVIVDYGVGNLHSIRRAIELAGAQAEITSDLRKIEEADGIVLPGVGAFKSAMDELTPNLDIIKRSVSTGKPILGICLGMQLSFDWSDEGGGGDGIGLVAGKVVKLSGTCKVPQMGWNTLEIEREHPFLEGIKSGAHVYFVHSYYSRPKDPSTILATTDYCLRFPSVVAKGPVIGTQFHPEKSGEVGLRMLKNFVKILEK